MVTISHRGNLTGPNPERENRVEYIQEALSKGLDVEIDVWFIDGEYYLGHTELQERIPYDFLLTKGLWVHCKNIPAYRRLYFIKKIISFWHQEDDVSLTSNELLWTYPGKEIGPQSIAVMPETVKDWNISWAYGVCTDYPLNYKDETF